jgi:hypothetical protein
MDSQKQKQKIIEADNIFGVDTLRQQIKPAPNTHSTYVHCPCNPLLSYVPYELYIPQHNLAGV